MTPPPKKEKKKTGLPDKLQANTTKERGRSLERPVPNRTSSLAKVFRDMVKTNGPNVETKKRRGYSIAFTEPRLIILPTDKSPLQSMESDTARDL